MKIITTLFLLANVSVFHGEDKWVEHPLDAIKTSIQAPEGWTFSQEDNDGVLVYQLNRNDSSGQNQTPFMTLTVTTKLPERIGQSPSEYAAALIDMSQEEGASSSAQKSTIDNLPSLRSEYDFEGATGNMHAVDVAIANDKTGTLYFFSWQAPMDEAEELKATREKILSSVKLDSTF